MGSLFFDGMLKLNENLKGMYAQSRFADAGAVGTATRMDPTHPVMGEGEIYSKYFRGYFQWTNDGKALNDPTWTVTNNSPLFPWAAMCSWWESLRISV